MDVPRQTQSDLKWLIIFLFLIAFVVYYMLKINGYIDISGKYSIKQIRCTQIFQNELFLIDGEKKTVWGLTEIHSPGEYIEFEFRSTRSFGHVVMEIPVDERRPVKFSISSDANEWRDIDVIVTEDADSVMYTFKRQEQGRYMRIEYTAEQEGYWPISEVIFHD